MAQGNQGPQSPGNMVEYVETQLDGLLPRPLGEVDSLVLSWLAYWRISPDARDARTARGASFQDLYDFQLFDDMTTVVADHASCRHLLAAIAASPRFRGLRIANYVEETDPATDKQFSAMTLLLPGGGAYVSFRGTDSTIVGWKEDFNLAFADAIPSQLAATAYLEKVARLTDGPLWVGGHSKGGNLAVYAAMNCAEATFGRIRAAFSHDGPGFTQRAMASGSWGKRSHVIRKSIPRSSVIGMLFEQQEDGFTVVQSTGVGILQHDPFSWVVGGCDFVEADRISASASLLDKGVNDWVQNMTNDERERFVDTLFSVFQAGGQDTFAGLRENWLETLPRMYAALAEMDPTSREMLWDVVVELVRQVTPDAADISQIALRDVQVPSVQEPSLQVQGIKIPEIPVPDLLGLLRRDGGADDEEGTGE